ncbi:MAG: exodeoxyribonuclease VII small subunit [Candidatus Riflebacteria bacterium]|nr:exodeoxyribonuclease VII small subunit [Candidatus Riflebacteria bacterium]
MEQKELTLEEALSKFERGIILSQFCKTRLEQAQGKIVQLTKENKLEDFMQSDE